MIYSHEAQELFEKFQAAVEENSVVIREFSAFAQSGNRDPFLAEELLKRMEGTGAKQAELLHQLQPFRLDV